MAIIKKNLFVEGASGMVGNSMVFRRVNGVTVMSSRPEKTNRPPSEAVLAKRERFREAVLYATGTEADETVAQLYEEAAKGKKFQRGFHVAVADFMKTPEIKSVDLSEYTGEPGQKIRIKAYDDFMVKAVRVTIENPDGSLVETGEAVLQPNDEWEYTAMAENAEIDGDKITIAVTDLPGNVAFKEDYLEG